MEDLLKQALQRGPECPELEVLFQDGAGVEQHVAGCVACQTELALYREFLAPRMMAGEKAQVARIVSGMVLPGGREKKRWWAWFPKPVWVGSAALACALLLTVVTLQHRGGAPGAGVAESDAMRSGVMKVTSVTGEVVQAPRSLEWEAVAGAAAYDAVLTEVDGTELFRQPVGGTRVDLPAGVVKLIAPGKTIFLEVTARDGAGRTIAASGKKRIRVAVE